MTPGPGIEPRPHWWEASALTTAPPLLPNTHQGENPQQTQPTYDAGSGNRTQATLVGGERSHHCATPAPQYTSRREPATNSTRIWRRVRESNPGHTGGRRAVSPLHHPCSPIYIKERTNNELNPHMTPGPGIEPRPHWWEASGLTTAPPLLPNIHQGENQQRTQPTYDAGSGNRTQATLVGGECSHHCATPAPQYTSRRTNNKLNSHMTPGPGIESSPHWWETSALTTAPPLLPNTHQGENQQQTQPTYDAGPGIESRPHWLEASVLTTTPPTFR